MPVTKQMDANLSTSSVPQERVDRLNQQKEEQVRQLFTNANGTVKNLNALIQLSNHHVISKNATARAQLKTFQNDTVAPIIAAINTRLIFSVELSDSARQALLTLGVTPAQIQTAGQGTVSEKLTFLADVKSRIVTHIQELSTNYKAQTPLTPDEVKVWDSTVNNLTSNINKFFEHARNYELITDSIETLAGLSKHSLFVEPGTKSVEQIQAPAALAYEKEAKQKSDEQTEEAKEREKPPSPYETETPEKVALKRTQMGALLKKDEGLNTPSPDAQAFAQQQAIATQAETATPQEKGHSPEAIKLGKMLAGLYEIATMTPAELNANRWKIATTPAQAQKYKLAALRMVNELPVEIPRAKTES